MILKIVPSFNRNTSKSLFALGGLFVPMMIFLTPLTRSATKFADPGSALGSVNIP